MRTAPGRQQRAALLPSPSREWPRPPRRRPGLRRAGKRRRLRREGCEEGKNFYNCFAITLVRRRTHDWQNRQPPAPRHDDSPPGRSGPVLIALLLAAALAACGGGGDAEPEATEQSEPARETSRAEATGEPEPTHSGLLGRVGSQATFEPDATDQPGGAPAKLEVQVEFASVSAGGLHTCGVKTDGSVACWGKQAGG